MIRLDHKQLSRRWRCAAVAAGLLSLAIITTLTRGEGPARMITEDRGYWAFQPVRRSPPPRVRHRDWIANPIDAFILARLEESGLEPSAPADRRELIRRACFDLTGLPPTPQQVDDFVHDPSPHAYAKLIDRLLDSPQYGERWGKFWLDVVRYGDTNGYERDGDKPYAWRYRDYVIRSFNGDKPYNQFVKEQLAGDELDEVTPDALIATGFYRLGVWDDEPDDKKAAEYDELDDIVRTTGTAFLGLTVNCARCHDHKFDPIPQSDYYSLLAVFHNLKPYESAREDLDSAVLRPLGSAEQIEAWRDIQDKALRALEADIKTRNSTEDKQRLRDELKKLRERKAPFEWALAVRERGTEVPETHVLIRGNASTPGQPVPPRFLSALGGEEPEVRPRSSPDATNGLRLALAQWTASPKNPLTARVMVNRIWQHHFGRGIVPTPDDFGKTGVAPTHPQLLDWLAAEFVEHGWSMKHLHRLIMTCRAYQMSSRAADEKAIALDPGNALLWRQNVRRLEAEAVRDSILAVSGGLNLKSEGPSFYPVLAKSVLATQSRPGDGWGKSDQAERDRRSVYMFIKRTLPVPLMEAFDAPNSAQPAGERAITTVAPQALMLLNGQFVQEQAAALGERVMRESPSKEARVDTAFRLVLQRPPTREERKIATQMLASQRQLATQSGPEAERIAFRSFCLALLNLNEFVYVD
jgi:hypothetical protein